MEIKEVLVFDKQNNLIAYMPKKDLKDKNWKIEKNYIEYIAYD